MYNDDVLDVNLDQANTADTLRKSESKLAAQLAQLMSNTTASLAISSKDNALIVAEQCALLSKQISELNAKTEVGFSS